MKLWWWWARSTASTSLGAEGRAFCKQGAAPQSYELVEHAAQRPEVGRLGVGLLQPQLRSLVQQDTSAG